MFYINAPGLANVTVSGLTLTGGDVNSSGGAISNSETLTIRDSVITGNVGVHASSRGGGIAHFFGTLTIERTTISDNFADHQRRRRIGGPCHGGARDRQHDQRQPSSLRRRHLWVLFV